MPPKLFYIDRHSSLPGVRVKSNCIPLMGSISYPAIFIAVLCFLFLRCLGKKSKLLRNWPLLGMLPDLLLDLNRLHDRITEVLELNGCTLTLKGPWFTNMDMLATTDPANVLYIFGTNFSNFSKGSDFKEIFDVMGDSIFSSESDLWRKQRRIAQAFINHRRFNRYLAKTGREKVEEGLIPFLEHASKHGLVVDLQDVFKRFTFDASCVFVTGYDPCSLSIEQPSVPFLNALDIMLEAILFRSIMPKKVWKLKRWLGVGIEKKLSRACQTLDDFIARRISMKREELSEETKCNNSEQGVDLLTSYMNEKEIAGLKFDDKFLRDTILNFIFAGRDTTSLTLTWFFWLVSKNARVEKRIREEIEANIPVEESEAWRVFSETKDLNKLVYLHGALCETLRLYPPAPLEQRISLRPCNLPSGHRVYPNMNIWFPLYAMGRMTSIWGKDCLEFKPERWISEEGGIKHEPSYKFMAFNTGPRSCLGKEVALTQMKFVATAMIHRYNIQVVEGHCVAPSISISLQMKYGLKVRVTKKKLDC